MIETGSESEAAIRPDALGAPLLDPRDRRSPCSRSSVEPDINAKGVPLPVQGALMGKHDAVGRSACTEPAAAHDGDGSVTELLKKSLIDSIEVGDVALVAKLIGLGAPLNERHGDKPLPLLTAVYVDNPAITRMLIRHGADPNARNANGSPALLDAIYLDRPSQVGILLDSGADTSIRTESGLGPLEFAESLGRARIVEILGASLARKYSTTTWTSHDSMLDVCICTHNPRRDVLALVISSIANQDADKSEFRVTIVDNASTPALVREDFKELSRAGIEFRILPEARLGNVFSRAAAIAQSTSDWVLFVDDDNELSSDYISRGLQIIRTRPELGCFGGRLKLPANLAPARWMLPLLPYLAVRDFGDAEITNVADFWGEWEPATAGGFVHRSVLQLYIDRIQNDRKVHELGRKGKRSLNSGEDSLMMWGAHKLGLAASYQPGLTLNHHINPERFHFWYFYRLMRGYGKSNAILDKLYSRARQVMPPKALVRQFLKDAQTKSWRSAMCLAAYHAAYNDELSKP